MPQPMRAPIEAPAREEEFLAGPGQRGLVTVVIPTYNRASLIGPAIESVLRQSYRAWEIIVADDGSTDDTRRVVESYGPSVHYVRQENAGVAAARNLGFQHARGEFVALLDSDDEWLPWKLDAQVRLLREHPEVGMVWTDMTAVSERGETLHERYLRIFYDAHELARLEEICETAGRVVDVWEKAPSEVAGAVIRKGDIFSRILLGNLVHTSTLLVRRSRLREAGGVDTTFNPRGEDYEFHLRICSHGPVALIEASSMLYRIGAPDQLTAPHMGVHTARSNLVTVLRWLKRGEGRIVLPERMVRDRLAQAHGWVGEAEMAYGEWERARPHLWQSLLHRPAQRKAFTLFLFSCLPAPTFHVALRVKQLLRKARDGWRSATVLVGGSAGRCFGEGNLEAAIGLGYDLAIAGGTPMM